MLTTFPVSPGTPQAAGPQEGQASQAGGAESFWVDLLNPTADEIAYVNRTWGLRVPSRGALEEIETSSRLRAVGGVLYLSMPLGLHTIPENEVPTPVGFVLSKTVLVTIRFANMHSVAHVVKRIEHDGDIGTSSAAFLALIEEMVDVGADTLEKLAAELRGISHDAFHAHGSAQPRSKRLSQLLRETLVKIGTIGEMLSQIQESLVGLQRIVDFTCDSAHEWLEPSSELRLRTVRSDLSSLADFEGHLSGKVQFLLDAVLGFINTDQNDMFKVLTIASVVGIPPTLIASMYGMNFHDMPELGWRWGYAYGLSLIALSTLVPIIWFKRRGWW
ncbi:MAG: magnesium transporter CorA family protein [Steroidobacteraceae bacterium]|jgi:magnesium transporter